jgi:hypothetical protein
MKKIYSILTALSLLTASVFSEGYFLNRLGACSDADGTEFSKDLFTIDEDDKSDMHFAEYAEFGYSWDIAEICGVFAVNNSAFETPQNNIKLAGYGIIDPFGLFSIIAGNDTRDSFSFSGGELYTENEAFLLQANPLADGVGLSTKLTINDVGIMAIIGMGAAKGAFLNAGLEVSYENDLLSAAVQITGQNILNKNEYYHYAVFGTASVSDFDFSLGYISNYNDQNINNFDKDEVSAQDYLPLASTHVLKLSARYKNDIFMAGFDGLTGLTDEYILNDDSKKLRAAYDAYTKYGLIPENPKDGSLGKNDNVPWLAAVKGGWFASEEISLYLKYSIARGNDFIHVIYPYTDWAFGENSLFRLGARFKIAGDKFSVSVPLMWQIKLGIN